MTARASLLLCLLSAVSLAEVKPAAIQVCVDLPPGEALFSAEAGPHRRAIAGGGFMLDLDVRFDGAAPEKVTRAKGSCLRAWLPPRRVRQLEVSAARLPLNLTAAGKALTFDLKPDLFYDAGAVALTRQPFSSIEATHPGSLTLERETATGFVREDAGKLPIGRYRVTFEPAIPARPCETQLEVIAMGSVTKERNAELLAELTEYYRETLLPEVLKKFGMKCAEAEVAFVQAKLVDGVFPRPYEPVIERRVVVEREPTFEVVRDGKAFPLSVLVPVDAGQRLEVRRVEKSGAVLAAGGAR